MEGVTAKSLPCRVAKSQTIGKDEFQCLAKLFTNDAAD